jgi:hypothetical protein
MPFQSTAEQPDRQQKRKWRACGRSSGEVIELGPTPAHSENDIDARAPLELVKGIVDYFRDTILTPSSRSHRKYEEFVRMA